MAPLIVNPNARQMAKEVWVSLGTVLKLARTTGNRLKKGRPCRKRPKPGSHMLTEGQARALIKILRVRRARQIASRP